MKKKLNKKERKEKYCYAIGDKVFVSGFVETRYVPINDTYSRKQRIYDIVLCDSFLAVIVGARTIPLGIREFIGEEEGTEFKAHGGVFVWEVRRGLTNKVIYVLPTYLVDLRKVCVASHFHIPIRHADIIPFTEEDKEEWRKYAKAQPRNAKGRFIQT